MSCWTYCIVVIYVEAIILAFTAKTDMQVYKCIQNENLTGIYKFIAACMIFTNVDTIILFAFELLLFIYASWFRYTGIIETRVFLTVDVYISIQIISDFYRMFLSNMLDAKHECSTDSEHYLIASLVVYVIIFMQNIHKIQTPPPLEPSGPSMSQDELRIRI